MLGSEFGYRAVVISRGASIMLYSGTGPYVPSKLHFCLLSLRVVLPMSPVLTSILFMVTYKAVSCLWFSNIITMHMAARYK